MVHLVYGEDIVKRQREIDSLVSLYKKQNISFERFDDVSFNGEAFLNTISSKDLFGEKTGVIISHGLSNSEIKKFFEENKTLLEKTEVPIIFLEGKFLKKDFPSFKKIFTSILECKKLSVKETSSFNVFSFVDVVVLKDRKKSWLLLQEAQKQNLSPEELIGPLFWQFKTLALVSTGVSEVELGIKPFVYSKAKKINQNYSLKELREKLLALVFLFRDTRNKNEDFVLLEKFILSS
jgi:DNA polymerase III delta subunit